MQYFVNQLRRLMLANGAVKRTTLALLDVLIAAGSAVLSFWLRLGTWEIAIATVAIFFAMDIAAWFVAAKIFGIYRQIIRYEGRRTAAEIVAESFLQGVEWVVAENGGEHVGTPGKKGKLGC